MIPHTTPTLELVIDGVDLTEATAIVTLVQGETEQLTTKAAATITPGTSAQTIAAGTYLTGVQTKGGGIWTFGNYADESFVATYFSTSTIANTSVNYPDQQIEFNADGTTSGFTVSTSQVVNLLPVQLYNNTSGTTGTVTLSQSAANFTRLRVFFTTGNAGYGSTEIWSPNGKDFTCIGASAATSSIAQIEFCKCHINGTSITRTNGGYVNASTNSVASATMTNQIKIVRVEGYKW